MSKIAAEILTVSEQTGGRTGGVAGQAASAVTRTLAGLGIAAIVAIIIGVAMHVKVQMTFSSIGEFLQGLDAAINEVVFIGVAAFFFMTLETRLKRRKALDAIRELRALAHIIDMHQLTKDPERITGTPAGDTGTIKRPQSPAELIRYLDNCSDLLALISKISALYVQDFDDPVTLAAVNEIENLTNGLSRKIWQKIMIFDRILAPASVRPSP